MNEPTPAQAARSEAARQLVILAFAMVTLAIMLIVMRPDALKTLRMRSLAISGKVLGFASRQAGQVFMTVELMTGTQEYTIPYQLSLLRDQASLMYRKSTDAG